MSYASSVAGSRASGSQRIFVHGRLGTPQPRVLKRVRREFEEEEGYETASAAAAGDPPGSVWGQETAALGDEGEDALDGAGSSVSSAAPAAAAAADTLGIGNGIAHLNGNIIRGPHRFPRTGLPPGAETDRTELKYSLLVHGEGGPARLYACRVHGRVKTCDRFPEGAWVYNPETVLWTWMDKKTWVTKHISPLLSQDADEVSEFVSESLDLFSDHKDMSKAWKGVAARVNQASRSVNSTPFLTGVARFAWTLLQDNSFAATLDAGREVLPFTNGVLDLRTLELAPLTSEHRLTYVLPYAWRADAPMDDMERLIANLFDEPETRTCVQTLLGYAATGRTFHKLMFYIWAESWTGKTTLLEVGANAMGQFWRVGKVPAKEISIGASGQDFQDTLSTEMHRQPPPRLLVVDETNRAIMLDQVVINNLCGGSEQISLSYNIKHKSASTIDASEVQTHAKVLLSTNHPVDLKSGDTGTRERLTPVPLKKRFIKEKDWDPATAHPLSRLADPALRERLLAPEARQGIVRWLALGAQRALDRVSLTCPEFEQAKLEVLARGDPYLSWILECYVPTGLRAHRLPLCVLVNAFKDSKRFTPAVSTGAFDGFVEVFDTMRDYITSDTWVPEDAGVFGGHAPASVRGYTGLKLRTADETRPWHTLSLLARVRAATERRGEVWEAEPEP